MKKSCLLFAYGTLQPGHAPPRSLSQSWPDRIKARLFDLGPYPAATQVGKATGWIEGTTLEIDEDELEILDEYEDTEGGEFARVLVETEAGHTAWTYEYRWEVPQGLQETSRWKAST